MILVDTSILSTFARVNALDALYDVFPGNKLSITPAILREITDAIGQGCAWLHQIPGLTRTGSLSLISPTTAEVLAAEALPDSLGLGEREAIALCEAHSWTFLTNDHRARNYCRQIGVEVFDLPGLLHGLWITGIRRKGYVRNLTDKIEDVEGITFKNKHSIFQRNSPVR
jgi:predicted nucleic acid-binding protein